MRWSDARAGDSRRRRGTVIVDGGQWIWGRRDGLRGLLRCGQDKHSMRNAEIFSCNDVQRAALHSAELEVMQWA